MQKFAYYQWPVADVEKHFEVTDSGLSIERASFRLQKYGKNTLEDLHQKSPFKILLNQLINFFIILLVGAALISFLINELSQGIILLVIVILNISLGFFQEYKAEKAISELKKSFVSKCKVIRDGRMASILSEDLVVGDLVVLDQGDRIPADLRIIEEESLRVDESALTGESVPVSKNIKVLPIDTVLADRKNMLFAGTTVLAGRGRGIVVSTGAETEFGKIGKLIAVNEGENSLEKQVKYIAKILTIFSFVACAAIFTIGFWQGQEIVPLLTFSIAIFIAAVPEGLPTAITTALAVGVSRMAKEKAVVRKMSVIETLGTINIIATDKTGTLTNNILSVDKISLYNQNKFSELESNNKEETANFLSHALACSNIELNKDDEYLGDPIEIAIAKKLENTDGFKRYNFKQYEKTFEIPFSSDKKYMAVLVKSEERYSLIVKGATEKVVELCDLQKQEKELILAESHRLSSMGYKVLALADKHLGLIKNSALNGLKFSGIIAFADQPTEGVREAIKSAMELGLRPIIITGDHAETARYIAEKIGFKANDSEILNDQEFDKLTKLELREALARVKIFARVTPENKINIVRYLKEAGYSVAMTGDGVNDSPALKEADAGIAMGIKGSDIAKDSADIVLSDDKYATIVKAIVFGRTIYDNIKNVIVFLVSGNIAELALISLSFILALPSPLTAIQILWVNLITDTLPALAISFETPKKGKILSKPRSAEPNSLRKPIFLSLDIAILLFIFGLVTFLYGLNFSIGKAQTLTFTYLVFAELLIVLSVRAKERIWQNWRSLFENRFLLISIAIAGLLQMALFIPAVSPLLNIKPLKLEEWIFIAIMALATFILSEVIHAMHDRKESRTVN